MLIYNSIYDIRIGAPYARIEVCLDSTDGILRLIIRQRVVDRKI